MSIWKLSPIAHPDDPHWKEYKYKEPLLVEAKEAGAARLRATRWYKEQFQGDPSKKIQQFYRSAFDDEKLYEVRRLTPESVQEEKEKFPMVKYNVV
ncbi:hypothetical protein [Sneathiella sp.]|uniref:hypothetical protein n=1 Tax=Sneathiella sp. TaxID=1964365 RepID=UPI00356B49AD